MVWSHFEGCSLLKTPSALWALKLRLRWNYVPGAMRELVFSVLYSLSWSLRTRTRLHLEIIALRHQLGVLQRRVPTRPKLKVTDRWLWVALSRLWSDWRWSLVIVKPGTVVAWHRKGFRLYWTWKSRQRTGRPKINTEVRELIQKMSRENPLWGAPRIHGELLKLGIDISQATVAKYRVRKAGPPSQSWRTFLDNHVSQLASIDFFTVPTIWFEVLFVFVVLATVDVFFTTTSRLISRPSGQHSKSAFLRVTWPYRSCLRAAVRRGVAWLSQRGHVTAREIPRLLARRAP